MKTRQNPKLTLNENGIFLTSLDFELYWGMRDKIPLEKYKKNILGARKAIPRILKLFAKYEIHATWATVGFLFYNTREELIHNLPSKRTHYINSNLIPYDHIKNIGFSEEEDPFHFAPSLIKTIKSYPHQEIGTHTLSHYYCLEKGQDIETFKNDLEVSLKIAKQHNIVLESLVFPRNQINNEYLDVCKEMGIKALRGNQSNWIYKAKKEEDISIITKGFRFIDRNFNISGHNSYSKDTVLKSFPFNFPASRFLYWYSKNFKFLESFRLQRILSDLSYTSRIGHIYHLWWHPHNFGVNIKKNLNFLEKILRHFKTLKIKYGMTSLNMGELAHLLNMED